MSYVSREIHRLDNAIALIAPTSVVIVTLPVEHA